MGKRTKKRTKKRINRKYIQSKRRNSRRNFKKITNRRRGNKKKVSKKRSYSTRRGVVMKGGGPGEVPQTVSGSDAVTIAHLKQLNGSRDDWIPGSEIVVNKGSEVIVNFNDIIKVPPLAPYNGAFHFKATKPGKGEGWISVMRLQDFIDWSKIHGEDIDAYAKIMRESSAGGAAAAPPAGAAQEWIDRRIIDPSSAGAANLKKDDGENIKVPTGTVVAVNYEEVKDIRGYKHHKVHWDARYGGGDSEIGWINASRLPDKDSGGAAGPPAPAAAGAAQEWLNRTITGTDYANLKDDAGTNIVRVNGGSQVAVNYGETKEFRGNKYHKVKWGGQEGWINASRLQGDAGGAAGPAPAAGADDYTPPGMCKNCKVKKVSVEGTVTHEYCGKSCRDQAASGTAGTAAVTHKLTVPLDKRPRGTPLPDEIKFYESGAEFYEFTNFWECSGLMIDGKQWLTTEHYFQAQKFVGRDDLVEHCRNLTTPRECFDMVRDPQYVPFVRSDWHRSLPTTNDPSIKDQVMYNAVMNKFTQDPILKNLLLSTAYGDVPRMIIENTEKDDYWGTGPGVNQGWANAKGVRYTGPWQLGMSGNNLGQLLVRIRDEIKTNRLHNGGNGYVVPPPGTTQQQPYQPQQPPYQPQQPPYQPQQQSYQQQPYQPAAGTAAQQATVIPVMCPPNYSPGMKLNVLIQDGRTLEVTVPLGAQPGQDFLVSVPALEPAQVAKWSGQPRAEAQAQPSLQPQPQPSLQPQPQPQPSLQPQPQPSPGAGFEEDEEEEEGEYIVPKGGYNFGGDDY